MRALLLQPDHGVGITRRIQQITRGTFDVKPGSLFPAVGRREIAAELTNWQRIVAAIGWAIKATS